MDFTPDYSLAPFPIICDIMVYYTFIHKGVLMIKHFRIHGDNIVECERLFNLITKSIQIQKAERFFLSPACPSVKVTTIDSDILFFEYFPGFNKNTSDRWLSNIFQILRDNGSFLNETPDVFLQKKLMTAKKYSLPLNSVAE